MPNANVTKWGLPCATSVSRKWMKSSEYPVEGIIQSSATAERMAATAAKKVTHPSSPNAPHFSLEKLYIPESSPIIRSFSREDGCDLRRREMGLEEEDAVVVGSLLLVEWRIVAGREMVGRDSEAERWKEEVPMHKMVQLRMNSLDGMVDY